MKVKLGPITYEVIHEQIKDTGIMGEISYRKATITVESEGMQPQVQRIVLMHEIAHALLQSVNPSETATEALSNQLLMFIRDNPEVIKFLQESDEEPK